jgi:glyoxylase-like metal-dependent hydrolase (beta-lactamase superfamily II)
MKLFPVNITNFKIDGGAMFGVVPKVLWEKQYPADENNLCNWALRSLLIDNGERVVLIDNGFGNKQSEKFISRFYLNNYAGLEKALAEHGYKPSDITDMVLTHLHYDHCGGGVKYNEDKTAYELTFPNAQYWVGKKQWETAMNPNKREKDSFLEENLVLMMNSGSLNLIEGDTELFPGFSVRVYNGHTLGQLIPFITFKDRGEKDSTLVFVADLLPSVAHIPLSWIMSYDVLPMVTLKEKEEFLKEAEEKNYVLFFQHDLYHECCNLTKTPKGIRAKDKFLLREMFSE